MKIKNLIQVTLAGLIVFFAFKYVVFAQSSNFASIDSLMSEEEQRRTGVYKLSSSEKAELKNWLDMNFTSKQQQTSARYTTSYSQLPTISQVTSDGNFVKLDDGTMWQIFSADTPISSGWLTPVAIKIEYIGEGDYPYTLTNTVTESKVHARKVTHIPNNPIGSFKNTFNNFKRKGTGLNVVI